MTVQELIYALNEVVDKTKDVVQYDDSLIIGIDERYDDVILY